jgi:hypothetical protein
MVSTLLSSSIAFAIYFDTSGLTARPGSEPYLRRLNKWTRFGTFSGSAARPPQAERPTVVLPVSRHR